MSKQLHTVTIDGKRVGQRRSDRPYTHALVLHSFNASVYRALHDRHWRESREDSSRKNYAFYVRTIEHPFSQLGDKYDEYARKSVEDARKCLAGRTLEQFVADERDEYFRDIEARIARDQRAPVHVLSWHQGYANAEKALRGAKANWAGMGWQVRIVEVDAK